MTVSLNGGVLVLSVIRINALLLGVSLRPPYVWKLPRLA